MPTYKSLGFVKVNHQARQSVWREVYRENKRTLLLWTIVFAVLFILSGLLLYRGAQ